jgi:hypothetical protein
VPNRQVMSKLQQHRRVFTTNHGYGECVSTLDFDEPFENVEIVPRTLTSRLPTSLQYTVILLV